MCKGSVDLGLPFSVINVHVLENLGAFGGCTGEGCMFELGLIYAEIYSLGKRVSIELENFPPAEGICLLDKRACIETEPFVNLPGHCTVVEESMAFLGLKKEMQYFNCHITVSACRSFSSLAAQNVPGERTKLLRSCLKHTPESELCSSASTNDRPPYGHPQATPWRVQPNEKQKFSFLADLGS